MAKQESWLFGRSSLICSLSAGYLVIQIVPGPRLMIGLNIPYLVDLISFDISFSLGDSTSAIWHALFSTIL